ncbi:MAG: DNA primase [Candidatus Promineifilaceae bacterium]
MSVTEEIKSRLDIVEIVESYGVQLRKSGRNHTGFCPFHTNTRTPAFTVNAERQFWRCYGACAEGGDIFSFVMKKEGWEFKDALKHLAQRAGVQLPEYKPKSQKQQQSEDRLGELLTGAADYFHQLLLYAPEAEGARQYLRSRSLLRRSVTNFQLGYSLPSYDVLRTHFETQGYTQAELIEVGLLTVNEEKGTIYDRFRNRLMFPIWGKEGRVLGFGARTLDPDGVPKYLNSPQTPLFDKSSLLYGLHFAQRDIREARQAVVVEGYMDVIRAHEAGFRNVVAQMGTALTEPQLQLLKRVNQIVIALDADEAGIKATERGLQVAGVTLTRRDTQEVNGRLVAQARMRANIAVVSMPEGKDPDDIIREDAARWPMMLAEAQPIFKFVIDQALESIDHSTPEGKSAVLDRLVPVLNLADKEASRHHYASYIGRKLKVDEFIILRQMRSTVGKTARKQTYKARNQPVKQRVRPSQRLLARRKAPLDTRKLEAHYLQQSLLHPRLMTQVDLQLKRAYQPIVSKDDFTTTIDQAVWQHVRRRAVNIGAGNIVSVAEMCDSLDSVLSNRIQQLSTPADESASAEPAPLPEQLPHRLTQAVLGWRHDKARRELTEVKQLLEAAKQTGDANTSDLHLTKCLALTSEIHSIDRAKASLSTTGQR